MSDARVELRWSGLVTGKGKGGARSLEAAWQNPRPSRTGLIGDAMKLEV